MTKDELFLRLETFFVAKKYKLSLKALDLIKTITGMRKDGVTPSVVHQLSVTNYLTPFDSFFEDADLIYAAAQLHDSLEDNHMSERDMTDGTHEDVTSIVRKLTKTDKSTNSYFSSMIRVPAATIIKGADRIHNCQSMVGVFSTEKQKAYITETKDHVIPMLKKARYAHPHLDCVLSNEIMVLEVQLELIEKVGSDTKFVENLHYKP